VHNFPHVIREFLRNFSEYGNRHIGRHLSCFAQPILCACNRGQEAAQRIAETFFQRGPSFGNGLGSYTAWPSSYVPTISRIPYLEVHASFTDSDKEVPLCAVSCSLCLFFAVYWLAASFRLASLWA
jgi:hypothetical protein